MGIKPGEVSRGSGRKIWWKCPRGPDHEWRASAYNRTAREGTGCPFCAGRDVSVTNSLATLRPDLAKQWHPTRNGKLSPDRVIAGSTRLLWWRCPVAPDHEWRVTPHDRRTHDGECPFCLGLRVCSTNSLATTRPRIASEWHPEKNHALTPEDVVDGSARRVWWLCRRHPEHEWRASVRNRAIRGMGCPICSRALPVAPARRRPQPTNIVSALWGEHRRIEQILALLVADPGVEPRALSRFSADLTAHLDAEASVVYPLLEHMLNRPLTTQRELQARLRRMLAGISEPDRFESTRVDRLRQLRTAFQEHSRFEEAVALPVLESVLDGHPVAAALPRAGKGSR
jgi:hypothetical protein